MSFLTRTAAILAMTGLMAGGAIAAPLAPLPAGAPAGVKRAALESPALILIGAGVVLAVTIGVVASGGNDKTMPTTTATGTAP